MILKVKYMLRENLQLVCDALLHVNLVKLGIEALCSTHVRKI
jgi:hypothetical protein